MSKSCVDAIFSKLLELKHLDNFYELLFKFYIFVIKPSRCMRFIPDRVRLVFVQGVIIARYFREGYIANFWQKPLLGNQLLKVCQYRPLIAPYFWNHCK